MPSEQKFFPRRLRLYEEGLNDREIADEVGVCQATVCYWRNSRKLPPNHTANKKRPFEERIRLYEKGLNDCEIADRVGVHQSTICQWRNGKGLPPNHTANKKGTGGNFEERMKLYKEGLNDYEIAEELGVCQATVCSWRKRRNLPPNGGVGGGNKVTFERRLELYDKGLTDSEIAEKVGVVRETITSWRNSRGLPCQSKRARVSDLERDRIHELSDQGLSDNEIAKKIGRTQKCVSDHRKDMGLKPNDGRRLTVEEIEEARLHVTLHYANDSEEASECEECWRLREWMNRHPRLLIQSIDGWAEGFFDETFGGVEQ